MRYKNKSYWRIPGGEIQWGHLSHTITVWFRGHRWTARLGRSGIQIDRYGASPNADYGAIYVDTYMPTYCCRGECCGPGSWCCAHAGAHDHSEYNKREEREGGS